MKTKNEFISVIQNKYNIKFTLDTIIITVKVYQIFFPVTFSSCNCKKRQKIYKNNDSLFVTKVNKCNTVK